METKQFLPRIESLRGLAALMVVGYHVWDMFSDTPATGLGAAAFYALKGMTNGVGAVVAFFVISGFVLARSLDRNDDPIRFFRNRVLRLLPAAAFVVALLSALHFQFGIYVGYEASFDPVNILLNMVMIKSDINGPMWSMTVECFAAPLIFGACLLVKSRGVRSLLIPSVLLFGLSFVGQYVHLLGDRTSLAPLYAFAAGIFIHFRGTELAARLSPRWVTGAAIFSIIAFCVCGLGGRQAALVLAGDCLSAAILVALIISFPTAAVFRPLDFKIIRFYGRISYSLYLLHMLGIGAAFRIFQTLGFDSFALPPFAGALVTTGLAIVCTTPLAYLSWRFVERPFLSLASAKTLEVGVPAPVMRGRRL